jgi:hypothetical protein
MQFKDFKDNFNNALNDEIKTLQKNGGQRIYLSDGTLLGVRGDKCIYSFAADRELLLPDDTPVILIHDKNNIHGTLVSAEDSDIIIALTKNIGDKIAKATLRVDPWFLLEELKNRLDEASTLKGYNRTLAEILLGVRQETSPSTLVDSQLILDGIAKRLGASIAYNQYQKLAVDTVLTRQASFIWGPPGTGKTSTLGLAVAALVANGESVLVISHSNTAVDTAIKSATKYLASTSYYKNGMVLRYGVPSPEVVQTYPDLDVREVVSQKHPELVLQIKQLQQQNKHLVKQSRNPNLSATQRSEVQVEIGAIKEKLKPLKQELRSKAAELITQAMVVGCTFSKATIAPEIYQRRFDAVIVDEASMAYIPHCAFVSTLAKKRVAIFGDFRQLGPISQAKTKNAETWLQRDIFESAGITTAVKRNQSDPRLVLLKIQYRMHPNISAIPNKLFYDSQLQDSPDVAIRTTPYVQNLPHPGSALIFQDITRLSASCFNETESKSRFNVISALIAVSIAFSSTQNNSASIGIITPYNAQSRLIQRLLHDLQLTDKVKAATVHRFQGDEQNLIVFDTVEGFSQRHAGLLLRGGIGTTAMRLANVAVSRAQGKFIALVNYSFFSSKLDSFNIFRTFVERLRANSQVEQLQWSDRNSPLQLPGVTYFATTKDAVKEIQADLRTTTEEVALYWSSPVNSQHFMISSLIKCSTKGIRFFLSGASSNTLAQGLQNHQIWNEKSDNHMGLVAIDRKILWMYLDPTSPSSPVLRIALPQTVKLLASFLRLVPDKDPGSIEARLEANKNPLGDCQACSKAMWLTSGKYGSEIVCAKNSQHPSRKVQPYDPHSAP